MAQILLEIQNLEDQKHGTYEPEEKVRLVFQETTDFILPVMKEIIDRRALPTGSVSRFDDEIREWMIYVLDNKAYFERATFLGLGIVAVGGDWTEYVDVLVGEEFLYISQMILDDIADGQHERVGKPTINSAIGLEKSLAVAQVFNALGYKLILEGISDLDKEMQREILSGTLEMMRDIFYAQYLDDALEDVDLDDVTLDDYWNFLHHTTPVDIANCFKIGCLIGGGGNDLANQLRELGHWVGMIMQVRDDFIDFTDPMKAGKSTLTDLKNGKKRLPLLIAYSLQEHHGENDLLRSLTGKAELTEGEVKVAERLVLDNAVLEQGRRHISNLKSRVRQKLAHIDILPQYKVVLTDMLDGLNI